MNFAAKLVLGNRGILFFQPVGFSVLGGQTIGLVGALLSWQMLFGGGVSF